MTRSKVISNIKIADYTTIYNGTKYDTYLSTIGIFDTHKVIWTYYVVSVINGNIMTPDVYGNQFMINKSLTIDNIVNFGIKFKDTDEANKYISDFKEKWESGTNISIQDVRDKKLNELTNE